MAESFNCWKCGEELLDLVLPLSRREICNSCHADQHVCKMCTNFDDSGRGKCTEDRADFIADHERANFCDYFKPSSSAYQTADRQKELDAKAKLAALFGDADEAPQKDSTEPSDKPLTKAEIAKQQLKDLFGD